MFFYQNNFIASTKSSAFELARSNERINKSERVHKTSGRRVGAFTIDKIILSEYNAPVDSRAAPGVFPFSFFRLPFLFSPADRDRDFIAAYVGPIVRLASESPRKARAAFANKRIEPYAIHNSRPTNSMSIMDRQYPSTV